LKLQQLQPELAQQQLGLKLAQQQRPLKLQPIGLKLALRPMKRAQEQEQQRLQLALLPH
jgi:hypothetical protein